MKNSDKPTARNPYPDRPLSDLPKNLALTFHPGEDPKTSRAMEGWVEALLDEAAGRLSCSDTDAGASPFLPSLSLRTRTGSEVHYHFVPEGAEARVFRESLWDIVLEEASDPPEPLPATPPLELLLFVSTHCPNCPYAARSVHALARKLPHLSVHFFEATVHADLAEKHSIQTVPTLLVERELRYVGSLDEDKLLSILGADDSQSLLHEKIRKQIKEGSALEAAQWIAGGGDPCFLASDLGVSTFEERIALLLALEEALESDPRCLDRMVEPLLPFLEAENASVRGDIADLLGKIGDRKALPALKKLCQDPDPNVVEAATEAVETLEETS